MKNCDFKVEQAPIQSTGEGGGFGFQNYKRKTFSAFDKYLVADLVFTDLKKREEMRVQGMLGACWWSASSHANTLLLQPRCWDWEATSRTCRVWGGKVWPARTRWWARPGASPGGPRCTELRFMTTSGRWDKTPCQQGCILTIEIFLSEKNLNAFSQGNWKLS